MIRIVRSFGDFQTIAESRNDKKLTPRRKSRILQTMMNGTWYHVIWNTLGSWLPGDPRGFRNRDHRIHSSGDYRNPPPTTEHSNLLSFNKQRARAKVVIPIDIRPIILRLILDSINRAGWNVAAFSIGIEHVHLLTKLSNDYDQATRFVGRIKTYASLAVREQMPGSIWSRGCATKRIQGRSHWVATRNYLTHKQERGSLTWDFEFGERVQT